MNLLKEVAEDRLVIMVSHNADLAAEYSTRTVRIVDGKVVDDTDPLIDPDDVEEEEAVLDESGEPLPKRKQSVSASKNISADKTRKTGRTQGFHGQRDDDKHIRQNLYSKNGALSLLRLRAVSALSVLRLFWRCLRA